MPALAKMETTKEVQDFMRISGWAYLGKKDFEKLLICFIHLILFNRVVLKDGTPAFENDVNKLSKWAA